MGRKNRRQPDTRDERPISASNRRVEEHRDGDWVVQSVAGAGATKTYRCPGCEQEIRPGTAHVVTWPLETGGGVSDRRHWHTPCWNSRSRRI